MNHTHIISGLWKKLGILHMKKQGVSQIALEATDMGRPLYERYGFVKMEDEMELVQ